MANWLDMIMRRGGRPARYDMMRRFEEDVPDDERITDMFDRFRPLSKNVDSRMGDNSLTDGKRATDTEYVSNPPITRRQTEEVPYDADMEARRDPRTMSSRPRKVVEPVDPNSLEGRIKGLEDNIRALEDEPVTNRETKNGWQQAWRGLKKFQAGWNGGKGGLIGGFSAATDPTLDERMNRQKYLNDMFGQLGQARQMQRAGTEQTQRLANIENILADNARADEQMGWNRDYRTGLRQDKAQTDLFKSPYFDPNNPVHAQQAIAAGLDPKQLVGWDNRNPNVRKIGGIDYQYDRQTGAWTRIGVDSNKLRAYTVRDADGKTETYMIPESEAAKFADQMARLRMQVEARTSLANTGFEQRKALQAMKQQYETQQKEVDRAIKAAEAEKKKTGTVSPGTLGEIEAKQKTLAELQQQWEAAQKQ